LLSVLLIQGLGLVSGPQAAPIEASLRGYRYLGRRRFLAAASEFRQGLVQHPDHPFMTMGLAQALMGMNRCEEGLELALDRRGRRAFNVDVANATAACFARAGNYTEAVYWKEEALYQDATKARDWANLALYHFRNGDEHLGEIALDEALEIDPVSPAVPLVRARVAIRVGDVDAADLAFQEYDSLSSQNTQMRSYLEGLLCLDLGHLSEAFDASAAANSFGTEFPGGPTLKAEVARRAGYLNMAGATLGRSSVRPSYQQMARVIQARLFADRGRFDDAEALVERSLAHSPFDPEALASAWYLAQARGWEEEARRYENAYEEIQTNPLRTLEKLLGPQ
jgi:Tfp pilus assembly protein PilF